MKLSASSLSLREEWRRSSWMRRAAALRSFYCFGCLFVVICLSNAYPDLRRNVPALFRLLMMFLSFSLPPLLLTRVGDEGERDFSGSPNWLWIKQIISKQFVRELRSSEQWHRWFYRFCLWTLFLVFVALAIAHLVILGPFFLIERAVLGPPILAGSDETSHQ